MKLRLCGNIVNAILERRSQKRQTKTKEKRFAKGKDAEPTNAPPKPLSDADPNNTPADDELLTRGIVKCDESAFIADPDESGAGPTTDEQRIQNCVARIISEFIDAGRTAPLPFAAEPNIWIVNGSVEDAGAGSQRTSSQQTEDSNCSSSTPRPQLAADDVLLYLLTPAVPLPGAMVKTGKRSSSSNEEGVVGNKREEEFRRQTFTTNDGNIVAQYKPHPSMIQGIDRGLITMKGYEATMYHFLDTRYVVCCRYCDC